MDQEELLNRIADRWGGVGCPRHTAPDGSFHFMEAAEDIPEGSGFRYVAYPPKTRAHLRECPDGRPFTKKVESDRIVVNCINDAPDAWWEVRLDGSYTSLRGTEEQL